MFRQPGSRDGGSPKIITSVVDGLSCDSNDERQINEGRYRPCLYTPTGTTTLTSLAVAASMFTLGASSSPCLDIRGNRATVEAIRNAILAHLEAMNN
ncbi:MAG: hypothetical protein MUC88_10470 [Planctomycetes bacterium]|nr:hypothetical protein [Planctomycetota bacterium]